MGHPLAFEVPVARLISIQVTTVSSVGRSHLGYTRVRSKLHLPVPTGSLAASTTVAAFNRMSGLRVWGTIRGPGGNARALQPA